MFDNGSLRPFEECVKTWAGLARTLEIERVLAVLTEELRRREPPMVEDAPLTE
jgi:hypothetical protein